MITGVVLFFLFLPDFGKALAENRLRLYVFLSYGKMFAAEEGMSPKSGTRSNGEVIPMTGPLPAVGLMRRPNRHESPGQTGQSGERVRENPFREEISR